MEAGTGTTFTIEVPLTGAAAALLWIDERQGRLGTTTALIRRGDRPATTVPAAAAPPLDTVVAPVAQSRLPRAVPDAVSRLPAVAQCAAIAGDTSTTDKVWSVHRLGRDTLLWSLPCGMGAYNFSQVYVLSANDGSDGRMVSFPMPAGAQDISGQQRL